MEQANRESFENLKENLEFYNHQIETMPLVFQYNKRDLKNISTLDKLNGYLNGLNRPYFEAVARDGRGVIETLREISGLTLVRIKEALEHATVPAKNVAVQFDVDHGQHMLKMEDLPVKKVSVEQMAASEAGQELPAKSEAPPAAAPAAASGETREARQVKPVNPVPGRAAASPGGSDPHHQDRKDHRRRRPPDRRGQGQRRPHPPFI